MLLKWTLGLEILFIMGEMTFVARYNMLSRSIVELSWWPLVGCWTTLLVAAFLPMNGDKWKSYCAVLVFGPIVFPASWPCGYALKPLLFERDLPRLRKDLALVLSGAVHGTDVSGIEVIEPENLSLFPAYKVWIEQSPNSAPLITFFVGNGGTVQTAYVYSAKSSDLQKIKGDWPRIYVRAPHWYEVEGATWSHVRFEQKWKASRIPDR